MTELTKYLVKESNARIGYTQSDEISLVLYCHDYNSQFYYDGKIFKIITILASKATAFFNRRLVDFLPEKMDYPNYPVFDCRAFLVPSESEAINSILWREQDATKNSISMAAQQFYSHKQLMGKNSSEKQEMLFQKGVNWNDYPDFSNGVRMYRENQFSENLLSTK